MEAYLKEWNERPHERTSLATTEATIPQAEFARYYQPRYEISPKTIALLLLKAQARVLRKNGVNCFQRHWYYWHEAMSAYKGQKNVRVEVRYTERDYRRVWVVLPQGELCEAALITPTSLLQPNKETLRQVAQARAQEKKLVKDFQLLAAAQWRNETTEERVASRLGASAREAAAPDTTNAAGTTVYQWTRFESLRAVPPSASPSPSLLPELSGEEETPPCFCPPRRGVRDEIEND